MAAITAFPLETGAPSRPHAAPPSITGGPSPEASRKLLAARSWADPSNCVDEYTETATNCAALQSAVNSCVGVLDNGQVALEDDRFVNCFCTTDIYVGLAA